MPQVSSTSCTVDIFAPNGRRFVFRGEEGQSALLAVETDKLLQDSVGNFTLHFAPQRDAQGRTWDQVIPMRSLVFIDMDRPGEPVLAVEKPTVMVGLTDDHGSQADSRTAQPRRMVTIRGHELSIVLIDAMLWYHPALARDPSIGTLTVQSAALGERELALTWNPKLARAGEDPRVILERILDYYLFVGGSVVEPADTPGLQQPLMNLDLPEVQLSDLLVKNTSAWSTFEPVTVPIAHHTVMAGSLWNYLHIFIDRHFQEFFTRIEDGVCKIYFRGKPFQHAVLASGTRFKSSEEEPTLQTLVLDQTWIQTTDLRRQGQNVYNVFLVIPLGLTQYYDDPNFLYKVLPQIVKEAEHPSFVGRYGLRILTAQSPYLTPLPPEAGTPPPSTAVTPRPAGASTYAAQAGRIARENGLPDPLIPWFVANIHQESKFNPNAVSPTGAKGIAQFTSGTAADMGLSNPFDPIASLHASARYWNFLRARPWIGNNPELIVAAYNAGPGAVQAAGGIPPGEATRHVRYVKKYMPLYTDMAGAQPVAQPRATTPSQQADLQAIVKTAERWSAILRAWHDMGGEMFAGTLTVRGHPAWNVGHRLVSVDDIGAWEAYIEGVSHQYDFRTGRYTTVLRITRGWYLDAAYAAQIREEGATTVTSATGGPPTVSPTEDGPGEKEVRVISIKIGDVELLELEDN